MSGEEQTRGVETTSAISLLAAHGFWRFLRSKRFWVALILCGLPAAATALILFLGRYYEIDELAERLRDQGWAAYLQVVVPVMALLVCAPAIGDEIDEGTIGYLTVRPVSRLAIFLGRFLGAVSWVVLFLGAGAIALVLASQVAPSELAQAFTSFSPGDVGRAGLGLAALSVVGGVVYGAIFTSLGAIIRRSMIVGIAYVFAIEGFLSALPGKAQTLTIQYHLKEALRGIAPGHWAVPAKGVPDGEVEVWRVSIVLGCVMIAALVCGAWALSRRAFVRAD